MKLIPCFPQKCVFGQSLWKAEELDHTPYDPWTQTVYCKEYSDISNISTNETLSRTLITSITTLLALFSIYIFGGAILKGFSFAMIIGVIVGPY